MMWIFRIWLIGFRGKMNEDPVLFTIKDKTSIVLLTLSIITVFIAL